MDKWILFKFTVDFGHFLNVTKELRFEVKGCKDAHLHLLTKQTEDPPFYDIVIGDWHNDRSILARYTKKYFFGDDVVRYGEILCTDRIFFYGNIKTCGIIEFT